MVITGIERQKKRGHRVSIFIDGKFALGIHENVFVAFGLRKGDSIGEATINSIQNEEEFVSAKDASLSLLSYRRRSEKELRQRLHEKNISQPIIDKTIEHLRALNLIDDEAFARAFVHDLILKKSAGKSLLQRELRQKGIAKDIIQNTLDAFIVDADEQKRALSAARARLKRYRTSRKLTDNRKQQQRITAFLIRRGFEFSTVNKVMRKLFSNKLIEEADES